MRKDLSTLAACTALVGSLALPAPALAEAEIDLAKLRACVNSGQTKFALPNSLGQHRLEIRSGAIRLVFSSGAVLVDYDADGEPDTNQFEGQNYEVTEDQRELFRGLLAEFLARQDCARPTANK